MIQPGLSAQGGFDTWSRRALRGRQRNLALLKDRGAYAHPDRYRRAVSDLERALELSSRARGVSVGLANYQSSSLSPLRSADLIRAAELPEDNPWYPYFSQRLSGLIEQQQPSLVGISLTYLSQALCSFAIAGFIKKRFPGLKLALGGGLVTSWLRRPQWKDPFGGLIDHLVAGPGEHPLLSIFGIAPENKYFTPDFDGLPLGEYLSPGTVLPYSASSGCYWHKCAFCPEQAEGNPYVAVPAERAREEIRILTAGMAPVLLHLLDNAVSPSLMRSFVEDPPAMPWYGFARVGPATC